MGLFADIEKVREEFSETISSVNGDLNSLEELRIEYLGKKGKVQQLFSHIGQAEPEDRPKIGQALNELKNYVSEELEQAKAEAEQAARRDQIQIDVTLPGNKPFIGHNHPVETTLQDMERIFRSMGFVIAEGPEIEKDYYNFEAVNFPPDHPARDMQDTFYIEDDTLLRTHTTPVQIRTMEKTQPPVRIISPGRVYRNEAINARSNCLFYQLEGLYVDKEVSFADLKGTLEEFVKRFFGSASKIRFRPSYFPFTEPSTEVDISCFICGGEGCKLCKHQGWLEILGAGMVDPNLYGFVDYDPEMYTGFAFGLGVDRIALMKYGVDDIRLLYDSDLRFLKQF